MDKQNNKLKTQDHSITDRRSLFLGGVIVFMIAITPFIFYSYESFPFTKVWETSFFTIETSFEDLYSFAWYVVSKAVPLLLLLIWFFTCKHWWHWIILVPIAMYAFQLWGVLNQNAGMDELEIYFVLPLMMILVPLVYLVRAKLFNKIRGTDLKSFEEDLLVKKTMWQQIRDLFR
mgnify:CR=1 FL=1|tara:strand:+ start:189774 stop:190298 length:525 start_codon:yes stop_codon:yes gene_type:complete